MNLRDILLALLVIFIWAANLVAIKFSVLETAPLTALALRLGLGTLFFLPLLKWPGWPTFIAAAKVSLLSSFLHQGLLFIGMQHMPAGITSILLMSQVIMSAVIGWLAFREKIGWRTGLGISCGMAGIVSIYGLSHEGTTVFGFWVIMLSALCTALAFLYMKRMPPIAPTTFLWSFHAAAFPFVLGTSLLLDAQSWQALGQANWHILGAVFAFQVTLVSLAHFLWQTLLGRNPMSLVTPFTLLLPVVSVALSVMLLGETLSLRVLLGGLAVMAGVAIIIVRRPRKVAPPLE